MIPFLQSIAEAYIHKYGGGESLQDLCFVFPNKRAGTFFLKYIKERTSYMAFSPTVTTITDLVTDLSQRVVNTRLDSLFLLHKCYCEIVSPHLTQEGRDEYLTFDSFRRWGETVLNDFNEVDIHLAEAEPLFKNLFDLRSIASTFLTEEQRDLMEEYFGYKVSSQYDDNKFWLEFGQQIDSADPSPDSADTPRSKFIHIWKVLWPLYCRFHDALAKSGLTTAGGVYRLAIGNLRRAVDEGKEALKRILPYRKIVMVGFNALSLSERELFRLLQSADSPDMDDSFVDFYWDSTGPVLSDRNNSAGRFVAINRRDFPSPEWARPFLARNHTDHLPPEINIVAAPSKVMQVKIAADIIADMKSKLGSVPFDDARVALVLPDESLLLPLLYSLPESLGDANLTMGYPLRLTAVTSFLALLRRLQLIRRDSSSYNGYDFQEIRNILGHPYAHAIIGTKRISRFLTHFSDRHISVIRESDLAMLGEEGVAMLTPLPRDASPFKVISYLDNVLSLIESTMSRSKEEGKDATLHGVIEITNVRTWRDALMRLSDTIEEYDVKLSMAGTMAEAYRLLQGEGVAFEGEPLRGLQIMGMLETRAIDFEHLVLVSVNDRTIPRKSRQRSFLPNVLRRGYGLPPVNYAESMFAYYFYRMMSRAKSVTFIYDSRMSGLTGGPSRYLLQLEYIYGRDRLNHIEYKFDLKSRETLPNVVVKTDEIMRRLEDFRSTAPENGKKSYFSASALKRYTHCPLKFYMQAICGLHDDPEPMVAVDPITYGNLIHHMMEILYIPDKDARGKWLDPPVEMTADRIDRIIADKEHIFNEIRKYINKEFYKKKDTGLDEPLPPDTRIVADIAVTQVIHILKFDRKLTPFNIYGCELKGELEFEVSDGRPVNMKFAIDRVDDAGCENADEIRIVDYKTGKSHIHTPSLEDMFNGKSKSDNLFQLELYAILLNQQRINDGKRPLSIKPVIYPVASIHLKPAGGYNKDPFHPYISKTKVETHDQIIPVTPEAPVEEGVKFNEAFHSKLDEMLMEIFNPNIPFAGEYEPLKCRNCVFKTICK